MKKYISFICILIFLGCDGRLDEMRPHNMSDASTYLKKFENVVNATSGLYALFYGKVGGFNYDYIYEVVYHTLGEFRGNNVVFAEPFEGTSDVALGAPDAHFYLYSDQKDQSFAWPMWIKMNQIVLGASKNIEAIKLLEKEPTEQFRLDELKRLKGENYFIRGLLLFHAVNAFGLPYWNEPDKNPGVPLDTTGSGQLLPRSSVKECYESIIRDFNNAASCLPDEKMDRSFANRAAAYGMLSRVYLYMGGRPDAPNVDYNKLAITYANKVFEIQNDVVDILQGDEYKDLYLKDPKTNPEVLFAFNPANFPSDSPSYLHSYYSWSGFTDSKEEFPCPAVISKDYENIMNKEKDIRWKYFTIPSIRHQGRYTTTKYDGGEFELFPGFVDFECPTIFIRTGEVILNRAEAYAKSGEDGKALIDLNQIRERAGLPALNGIVGQQLKDSIFMERRRELAFEAQVYYDYTRNGIKLSREDVTTVYQDYIGRQYNEVDPSSSRRIVCLIPSEELKLNPALVQNIY